MGKTYKSKGIVLGNCWGGGMAGYEAVKLEAPTRDALVAEAKAKLEDGSLDSGMGFESLIGAVLLIKEVDTRVIDGKEFTRHEYSSEFIGDLTEDQEWTLDDLLSRHLNF